MLQQKNHEVKKDVMRTLRNTKEKEEIGKLLDFYRKNKLKIKDRLNDFSKVPEKEYFYELCFCLCTPQSKARKCDIAVSLLKEKGFLDKNVNPLKILHRNVRFHINKSRYLLELKRKFPSIDEKIKQNRNKKAAKELREWLVKNVKGLGYKEASHFLRNIGFRNLAILDRHILKNMIRYGAIKDLSKTLTKKEYLRLEGEFGRFSEKIGIDMDELDLVFWSMETGEIFK